MKDLSIVIVNWNSKDYVRDCLASLVVSCGEEMPRVIVVDGASFDGCDKMLSAEFPDVTYVQSPENIGFGRCNNLGFEKVDTEYVLFLNPDTEVQGDALTTLLDYLKAHPEAGIIGAKLLNTDGSLQGSSVQALPTPLNQAIDSNFLRKLLPGLKLWGTRALLQDAPAEVEAISGACMLMRSKVFSEVGGFDPAYFMYAEDMDLSWKVGESGRKNVHLPAARITHHGGGSSAGEFSEFSNVAMRTSLHHFMNKRSGKSSGLFYRVAMGGSAIVRIFLLLPAMLMRFGGNKNSYSSSLKKWRNTLSWSLKAGDS